MFTSILAKIDRFPSRDINGQNSAFSNAKMATNKGYSLGVSYPDTRVVWIAAAAKPFTIGDRQAGKEWQGEWLRRVGHTLKPSVLPP